MTDNGKTILWVIIAGLIALVIAIILAFGFNIRDGRLPAAQLGSFLIILFIHGWIRKGSLKAWLKEFI